jgi:hypothetical protein
MTINLQDQQFLIGAQHSGKENRDQMEAQNLVDPQAVSHDQVPVFHHHNQAGRKKDKAKNSNAKHARSRNS